MKLNQINRQSLSSFSLVSMTLVVSAFLLFVSPSGLQAETVYFEDDFESGDLSKWTSAAGKAKATTTRPNNGSRSLYIPYDITAGGDFHRDNNRFVEVNLIDKGLEHFFVRGCFNLSSTTAEAERPYNATDARKMFFIFGQQWNKNGQWDFEVNVNGGRNGTPLAINIGSIWVNEDYNSFRYPVNGLAKGKIKFDTWHCLELEMKLNDPGVKNANVRLWLDGSLVYERVNTTIRKDTRKLHIVRVGAQIDRQGDALARHEDRYWDDIKVSDTFSSLRPKAPTH